MYKDGKIQILVSRYLTTAQRGIAWVKFTQEYEIITFKVKFF